MSIRDTVKLWRLRRRSNRLRRDCNEAANESLRLYTEDANQLQRDNARAKTKLLEDQQLRLDAEIRQLSNEKLLDQACRWGVNLFSDENLVEFEIRKRISAARLAYCKDWAQIIVPILALIVAILALLKK